MKVQSPNHWTVRELAAGLLVWMRHSTVWAAGKSGLTGRKGQKRVEVAGEGRARGKFQLSYLRKEVVLTSFFISVASCFKSPGLRYF